MVIINLYLKIRRKKQFSPIPKVTKVKIKELSFIHYWIRNKKSIKKHQDRI